MSIPLAAVSCIDPEQSRWVGGCRCVCVCVWGEGAGVQQKKAIM